MTQCNAAWALICRRVSWKKCFFYCLMCVRNQCQQIVGICKSNVFYHLKHNKEMMSNVRATAVTQSFNSEGFCLPVVLLMKKESTHLNKLTEGMALLYRHDANPHCSRGFRKKIGGRTGHPVITPLPPLFTSMCPWARHCAPNTWIGSSIVSFFWRIQIDTSLSISFSIWGPTQTIQTFITYAVHSQTHTTWKPTHC